MFGQDSVMGGMDQGGDVNADVLGFSGGYGAQGPGVGGGGYGQGMPGGGYGYGPYGQTTLPQDPAEQAQIGALQGAGATQKQGGIGGVLGNQGLMGDIFQVTHGRRTARAQRSFLRKQADYATLQSMRRRDDYLISSQREEQNLQQSFAGRGIGQSSIAQEGMDYFDRMRRDALTTMGEEIEVARANQRLVHSQLKQSFAKQWMNIGQDVLGMIRI